MKTVTAKKALSVKAQAILSAAGMAILICGHLLGETLLSHLCCITAFLLVLAPLLLKRDVRDELARENEAKSMRVTLFAAYAVLLLLGILDFGGVKFTRTTFQIALCGLLCFQSLSLAFFEGRSAASDDEEV
ncbi:MAG TPA: hypothetical protein DDX71_03440 [Ruminococcus sp.]|nr:hypothetical protein [Ruminococcus sp.]